MLFSKWKGILKKHLKTEKPFLIQMLKFYLSWVFGLSKSKRITPFVVWVHHIALHNVHRHPGFPRMKSLTWTLTWILRWVLSCPQHRGHNLLSVDCSTLVAALHLPPAPLCRSWNSWIKSLFRNLVLIQLLMLYTPLHRLLELPLKVVVELKVRRQPFLQRMWSRN